MRVTWACALAALVMAGLHLRARLSTETPRFAPGDETGYFRAESALQYRYARMAAFGEAIPALDRDAQYPEGVRTKRELTLWMERAAGWSYRLLPERARPDFHWFIILWVALVSSLSIPALYALARRLARSRALAFGIAACFGLSWASMSGEIATFDHECFAFPLIAASLACLAAVLDREERRPRLYAAASALSLWAALASWHFTRFYAASLLLAGLWSLWRHRSRPEAARRLTLALLSICASALAAWVFVPSLRSNSGIHEGAAFGHVYALFFAKLRHGLVKPADPGLLSPAARLLWLGPFNSPDPGFVFFALTPLALLALPRLLAAPRKDEVRPSPAGTLVDAMLLLYAAGAALVSRLMPMAAFFLCASASRLPERLAKKRLLAAAVGLLACLEAAKSLAPASRYNPVLALSASFARQERRPPASFEAERDAIAWLKVNGQGRPVLANFGLSPSLLAYASSPILLQPKFESASTRAKAAEFLAALYSDEEAFYAFCREYGAGLFVYTTDDILDETADGPRYTAGTTRLSPTTAAVLFHFHPGSLRHFRLAHQNAGFRIFEVGASPRERAGEPAPLVYDIKEYHPELPADGSLRLDVAGALARMRKGQSLTALARLLARFGRREAALRAYEEAYAAWPEPETKTEAARLDSLSRPGRNVLDFSP